MQINAQSSGNNTFKKSVLARFFRHEGEGLMNWRTRRIAVLGVQNILRVAHWFEPVEWRIERFWRSLGGMKIRVAEWVPNAPYFYRMVGLYLDRRANEKECRRKMYINY